MDWHEVINSLARFYADTAAAVETSPPELCVGTEGAGKPLARVVRDEVVRTIFRWPQWQLLLQNSANGYIQPPTAAVRTSRRVTTPSRSDDLLRPFEQCVKDLDGFTRTKAGEAIDTLLTRLAEGVKTQRAALGVFCQDAAIRERLKEVVGSEYADLVDVLYESADPTQLGAKLRKACLGMVEEKQTRKAEDKHTEDKDTSPVILAHPSLAALSAVDPLPPLNPSAVFPLPVGLKFGWNEQVWKELSPDQRSDHTHQSWVPRIRDTLISSVDEALFALVGEISIRAVVNLRKECNELTFLLQNEIVAGSHDFVKALEKILLQEPETPVRGHTDRVRPAA